VPLFSLYGFLDTRAGGALDSDPDSDFDFEALGWGQILACPLFALQSSVS
jgi:hypothetical protein